MKPLVRWTFGPTKCLEAVECLQKSIWYFRRLYQKQFDFVVLNNSLRQLDVPIPVINQKDYIMSLSFPAFGPAWKLFPPRFRPESHEIFIDNDFILYKKHPVIDNFLKSTDMIFCTEGLQRRFGIFSNLIDQQTKINTGFFGVPPFFELGKNIENLISLFNLPPFFNIKEEFIDRQKKIGNNKVFFDHLSRFDEQGCLSAIFTKHKNLHILPLKDISVCSNKMIYGKYGAHFVGINNGKTCFFNEYKQQKLLKM